MKLEPADGPHIDQPTDEQIAEAIRRCKEFVILSADEGFIQTSGDGRLFTVEYHEGPGDRQFRAAGDLSADQTIALFQAYHRGDPAYRTAAQWQDISDELAGSGRQGRIVTAVVFAVVIIAIIAYFVFVKKL